MKVESVHVKNFRVFKDTAVSSLSGFSVFLGTSGAGKSTLFQVFDFLTDALRTNVTTAVNRRGGFHELLSRGTPANQAIEFAIKFRDRKLGTEGPLVTYELKVGWENQRAVVLWEVLRHRRDRSSVKPWNFLMFQRGKGYVINNEADIGRLGSPEQRDDFLLDSSELLAIKGSGQLRRNQAVTDFRELLEGWKLLDFQDEALAATCSAGIERRLSASGNNLAQATKALEEQDSDLFKKVVAKMVLRFPELETIKTVKTKSGQFQLQFKEQAFSDALPASSVSSGILRTFAYLVLLNTPAPLPMLCIEEPERHLDPEAVVDLAKELREYAHRGGQVLISTHSPSFVNYVHPSELHFIRKNPGGSVLLRADRDTSLKAKIAAGHHLGNLWQRGLISAI